MMAYLASHGLGVATAVHAYKLSIASWCSVSTRECVPGASKLPIGAVFCFVLFCFVFGYVEEGKKKLHGSLFIRLAEGRFCLFLFFNFLQGVKKRKKFFFIFLFFYFFFKKKACV